jgi:bacterial/archaeal transporter family-2 protein
VKVQFWLIAMACGAVQVLQSMVNGSAARMGFGAIWAGAISAAITTLALSLTALVVYRLPFPQAGVLSTQGTKVVLSGLMGAFNLASLTFVAPRLGPTQTFLAFFLMIVVTSALIDSFPLFGTDAKPLAMQQYVGILLAGLGVLVARA